MLGQEIQIHKSPTKMRRLVQLGAAIGLAIGLTACQSANIGDGLTRPSGDIGQQEFPITPNPNGEVIGQGRVRIALLIPKTAPGNAATVANEIRNGAAIAMQDFGENIIQLVIKDTKGRPADAQAAASEAISEGTTAFIGPLFSGSVSAASGVTLPANKTIIGFSTDTSIARRGVYLINYTPQADAKRIITFAIAQGKRSIHAFLSNDAVGNLREAMLRQVAGANNADVSITRYEHNGPGIETAVRSAVNAIANADSIYIPEGGQIPEVILAGLKRAGANIEGKQVLGSGQWESVKLDNNVLEGAWYTGRDIAKFNAFADRYRNAYNASPGVNAALGYDAVTLITKLVNDKGPQGAFSPNALEDRRGFDGINGIFKLNSDGTTERGLAIYKVSGGKGQTFSPAPTNFGSSS